MAPDHLRARPTRVVLFHGLASSPKEFGFLTHPLRRHGLTLQAPDIPGYSAGLLADCARWQDWVDAAGRRVEALTAGSSDPFVLGGLCTGSLLAVALAASRRLPGLGGIALLSPLFAYDGWSLPWWYKLRVAAYGLGLSRHFSMRERPPYGLKNERMRQWVRRQLEAGESTAVGPASVSLQLVRESERLSRHVVPLLSELSCPILVQHAREDEICNLASVRAALRAVPPRLLSFHVLDNSYHMITADNDRHLVADTLSNFMRTLELKGGNGLAGRGAQAGAEARARVAIES